MRKMVGIVAATRFLLAADGVDSAEFTSSGGRSEPSLTDDRATEGRRRVGAPVFVVGFQRSGTSLLTAMLNEHPNLAVSTDSQFIPRFWHNRDRYTTDEHVDAGRLVRDALSSPRVREWNLPEDVVSAHVAALGEATFADAVRVVFESYAEARGKPTWGDKTPGYVLRLPLLASLFPDARFVHVIRDGRDATVSCLKHGFVVSSVAMGADLWVKRVGKGRSTGRELGPQRYLEVRYEDLAADPTAVLTSVCGFLDLEFDARMLRYTERALSALPERVRYRHENLTKAPTPGLRDWRVDMTPSDVAVFQTIGGRLLDQLGYERGVARIPIGARLRAWREIASFRARAFVRLVRGKVRGGSPVEVDRA